MVKINNFPKLKWKPLTGADLDRSIPEGFQPQSAALLHVDHVSVVSLQRSVQAVHRLKHQVFALVQLLLEHLQSVNLCANTGL